MYIEAIIKLQILSQKAQTMHKSLKFLSSLT